MIKFWSHILILVFFTIFSAPLNADTLPPRRLIITPTAGLLPGRNYLLDTHLYDEGGVAHMIGIGVTDLVNVGVSYSGSHIIGSSKITWQPHVAFQVRIRIVEETLKNPALSVGFDSQGDGPYIDGNDLNRFRIKSRGVYAVVSRNYLFFGDMGVHGGINYSLETDDGDRDPSFWVGFNKSVGGSIELCGEYDFATNDNKNESITANSGYLNAALRWNFGDAFTLEFDLKNILRNERNNLMGLRIEKPEPSREIRFFYRGRF